MKPVKVTVMTLDVDLECSCCYKKVKNVLCKFPQIRNQMFDEDKNKVTVTVVCCDPEKLRDKLCCKGGKAIRCIEIVENKPPKPIENPKHKDDPPKLIEKPKTKDDPSKHTEKPNPKDDPPKHDPPTKVCCQECYEGHGGGPCHYGNGRPVPPPQPCPPVVVPVRQPKPHPTRVCCQECYEGQGGGPCHYGNGRPVPPPQPCPPVVVPVRQPKPHPTRVCCQECYEGQGGGPCHYWNGRPVPPPQPCPPVVVPVRQPKPHPTRVCCQECYEGHDRGPCHYGYGRPVPPPPGPCYVSRCDYFSEENPQGCSIM